MKRLFAKYVSQNVLGMIGISFYILADTYFISKAEGANGITALNLVLPIYSLIFAIGAMIGVGSAIRFKILRAKKEESAELYFSNAVLFGFLFGLIFMLFGGLFPEEIVSLMGGNKRIIQVGATYTRIFMLFAPFFIWNHICNAFVRNDGAPTIAMVATFGSSLFNIVMDYVLMFPLGLGMAGAALATAVSPMIGILICCIHFFSKKNTISFQWTVPSLKKLLAACQLGVSAFIGEFASGVTTIVFNMLILGLAGNVGVAAYGVIANTALVATSVFNGISQGAQPLFSEQYGKGKTKEMKKILQLSIVTSMVVAVLLFLVIYFQATQIVEIFNSNQNKKMAFYAVDGLKIYFIGFFFAGFNIVGTGYLSAVQSAKWAFLASMLRGIVAIILCAVLLSWRFKIQGVWLGFPVAEFITAMVTGFAIKRTMGTSSLYKTERMVYY